jgi:hypothetical protein
VSIFHAVVIAAACCAATCFFIALGGLVLVLMDMEEGRRGGCRDGGCRRSRAGNGFDTEPRTAERVRGEFNEEG